MEKGETLLYSHQGQLKLHVQVHYYLTHNLMGATLYYLTLAEYDRCPKLSHHYDGPRRKAWNKSCTIFMYETIKYLLNHPSYTTKGKLRDCIASEKF